MPRRAASVTQADIARAIRAAQATGLPVVRIVVRPDGVAVETAETAEAPVRGRPLAERERVVVL